MKKNKEKHKTTNDTDLLDQHKMKKKLRNFYVCQVFIFILKTISLQRLNDAYLIMFIQQ